MKWIGLTGGIACGKSTVSQILRRFGRVVIDADQLARDVVQVGTPGLAEVVQAFGPDILQADQSLDRQKIASLVFHDPAKLKKLESILHPRIRTLTIEKRKLAEKAGEESAFYDVPLLFEKAMEKQFDLIVVVACPAPIQISRLIQRNGLSRLDAEARIKAQLPMDDKIIRADFTVMNTGKPEELELEVRKLLAFVDGRQAQVTKPK